MLVKFLISFQNQRILIKHMIDRHGSVLDLAFFLVGEFLVGRKGKKVLLLKFTRGPLSSHCQSQAHTVVLPWTLTLNHTRCEALCWISLSLIIYRSDFSLVFMEQVYVWECLVSQ